MQSLLLGFSHLLLCWSLLLVSSWCEDLRFRKLPWLLGNLGLCFQSFFHLLLFKELLLLLLKFQQLLPPLLHLLLLLHLEALLLLLQLLHLLLLLLQLPSLLRQFSSPWIWSLRCLQWSCRRCESLGSSGTRRRRWTVPPRLTLQASLWWTLWRGRPLQHCICHRCCHRISLNSSLGSRALLLCSWALPSPMLPTTRSWTSGTRG
mmetsp:Transcript_47416/g.85351  ORF Transcript_47416/g.85351 Transcript_47416/m.85351 type:complete len:205 (+) Transcript_47416:43-657(+)